MSTDYKKLIEQVTENRNFAEHHQDDRYAFAQGAALPNELLFKALSALDLGIYRLNETLRDYVTSSVGRAVVERDLENMHRALVEINAALEKAAK